MQAITNEGAIPLSEAGQREAAVPWDCWLLVFAATCVYIGITWDISWHQTIGRDTFWTPAHVVIYVGGVVAGCCGGWRVLHATFWGAATERATCVRLWGFYAPIGVWVAIWGALAMVISAPFDNWWHDAYGLDVQIISPPHSVLAAGMHHVVVGALLLVVSLQNRAHGEGRDTGRYLFLYAGGVMIALAAIFLTEFSFPNLQRTAKFYQSSSALYPVLLVAVARTSTHRWAATWTALIFMGLRLGMSWVLPVFEGTPKLAPIYQQLEHMVPPSFPILLVVPAVAIDLWFRWLGRGRGWKRDVLLALAVSVCFVGLVLAVHWPFSQFMLTSGADNWFFAGNRYWSYNTPSGDWHQKFWYLDENPVTKKALVGAWVRAFGSSLVGLVWGHWMSFVKR